MSASVAVYRNIYTEDRFKQAYGSEEKSSGSLRLRERLAGGCRCSRRAWLHLLKLRVPIFSWLPRYRFKKWILGDTIAGLTVGILHIPQGEYIYPPTIMNYSSASATLQQLSVYGQNSSTSPPACRCKPREKVGNYFYFVYLIFSLFSFGKWAYN